MGILRTNTLSGIGTDGPVFDGVTRLDTFGYVVPPVGVTSDRTLVGVTTAQGSIRFNTDSQKLEFYAQDQWWEMVIDTPALAVGSNTGAGARGIIGAGYNDGATNRIDYITISSTGNSTDFGDATVVCSERGQGFASSTRGIFAGGVLTPGGLTNTIDYVTISSTGNAADFGDLTSVGRRPAGCSNSTRGINFNGNNPTASNVISYNTIASTGNAVDFGDLTDTANEHCACASSTRGVIHLGSGVSGSQLQLDFVTISTTGNAQDFGLLSLPGNGNSATSGSNSTRGLFSAFYLSYLNYIEYVTITTTGNSTHFGDLTQASKFFRSTMTSPTRAVIAGGRSSSNVMEYVNIQTEGNSVDFGDLTQIFAYAAGFSNAHGGL
jgi:hypothetical protein